MVFKKTWGTKKKILKRIESEFYNRINNETLKKIEFITPKKVNLLKSYTDKNF